MGTKFIAVLRVSTSRQGDDEKEGLPIQRRLITEWLKANGHPPATREIIDTGLSAGHLLNLSVGKVGEEIAKLKKKKIKPGSVALVFAYTSRFSRAACLRAQHEFTGILLANIDMVFALQNIHISTTDSDTMMYMKLGAVTNSLQQARDEWLGAQMKLRGRWEGNRERWIAYEQGRGPKPIGQPLGLTCWWHCQGKNGVEVRKPEAKLVKKIFDLYTKEGMTIRGIATHLNEKKIINPVSRKKRKNTGELVKSRKNAHGIDVNDKWASSSIKHVLTNRTVIGEFEFWTMRKEEDSETGSVKRIREKVLNDDGTHQIIKKYCPAIITKTQFLKVQTLIEKNKNSNKGQKVTKSPTNIFRGILFDGHTEHSISYSHSGGRARGFRYRSSVQKHRGEKANSFSVIKFEEAFFKIYAAILTSKDLFVSWQAQASTANSGRATRIAEIEEEINHINDGNDNLLAMIERGKAADTLAERIVNNNRKKEKLTTEKINLESTQPVNGDDEKHRKLLGSMEKFCNSETKRKKVAKILDEIGLKIWVWPQGLFYNQTKMLEAFRGVSAVLGKKNNWINFNSSNFEKYPFFFIQEFLYQKLAKICLKEKTRWKQGNELDFMLEMIHNVSANPVENFSHFYDITTKPETQKDLIFISEKPNGTFFSGILNTSKHSKPVIKYLTTLPTFATMVMVGGGDKALFSFLPFVSDQIINYPILKAGINEKEENNMTKLLEKILMSQKITDPFPNITNSKMQARDKKNIFNRRMIGLITMRMIESHEKKL